MEGARTAKWGTVKLAQQVPVQYKVQGQEPRARLGTSEVPLALPVTEAFCMLVPQPESRCASVPVCATGTASGRSGTGTPGQCSC